MLINIAKRHKTHSSQHFFLLYCISATKVAAQYDAYIINMDYVELVFRIIRNILVVNTETKKQCVIEEKLYYFPVLQHAIFDLLVLIFYLYGAIEYLWYKKALSLDS